MFLNMLNQREKENFLELAYHAMKVNGELVESEQNIYDAFKVEMEMHDYVLKHKQQDELARAFTASTKKVKKVVVMELLAILVADDEYDRDEENFIDKLAAEWNLRQTEVNRMTRWVMDFNELLDEGFDYIME